MTAWPAAAAVLARLLRARRRARIVQGEPPGVRTDDGVLLHTEVDGPPAAEPAVVLVHGFAARLEVLGAQRRALRERTRVVAFNLRGHGRSGWPGPWSATMERLGRDLACVLEAEGGPGRVVLVGHSLGGMVVLALARRRPDLFAERVAAVALLSTSAAGASRTRSGRAPGS